MDELRAMVEGTDDDLHIHACQQIWGKKLADGGAAVVFVNFDTVPVNLTCGADCFAKLGFPNVSDNCRAGALLPWWYASGVDYSTVCDGTVWMGCQPLHCIMLSILLP